MDKDEHPVRWLLDNFDKNIVAPMTTWLDQMMGNTGLGSFWDDDFELPAPRQLF